MIKMTSEEKTVMKGRNIWFFVSICLIVITAINASLTIYYYGRTVNDEKQYNDITGKYNDLVTKYNDIIVKYNDLAVKYNESTMKLKDVAYNVDILIKYENGTKVWYNQTTIPIGWSLFNATLKITNGNVIYSTAFGSPYITTINGVKSIGSFAWIWYTWNSSSAKWTVGATGSNEYILRDKDVAAWYLANISDFNNLPQP